MPNRKQAPQPNPTAINKELSTPPKRRRLRRAGTVNVPTTCPENEPDAHEQEPVDLSTARSPGQRNRQQILSDDDDGEDEPHQPGAESDAEAPPAVGQDRDADFDKTLGGALSEDGEVMYVSATVGRRALNVYDGWLDAVFGLLRLISFKCAIGLEVGPKGGAAHLQITAAFLVAVPFKDACALICTAIKSWIPIVRGSKGYAQVKPLVGSQTFLGMLGYVSKLPLAVKLHNVTPGELKEGQRMHQLVRTDPLSGKRHMNKSNFLKEVFSFWHRHLRPVEHPIEVIVLYMLWSGEYLPTAVWIVGGAGEGLDFARAVRFWSLLHSPTTATMEDVMAIFFSTRQPPRDRYFGRCRDGASVPTVSFEEACEQATEARKVTFEHTYTEADTDGEHRFLHAWPCNWCWCRWRRRRRCTPPTPK